MAARFIPTVEREAIDFMFVLTSVTGSSQFQLTKFNRDRNVAGIYLILSLFS